MRFISFTTTFTALQTVTRSATKNSLSRSIAKTINKTKQSFQTLLLLSVFNFAAFSAFADFTVASGATIDASTITGQTGVLTVNGRLNISTNVSLLGFSSVVINGPSGQIYWTTNSDLSLAANTSIVINNPALGLQPTVGNGNASQRLVVGTTVICVSSDNSNNAAFSFEQFNALGGLPQFTITGNNAVCNGSAIALTITPDRTSTVSYTYNWTISGSTANFTPPATTSFTSASTSITPAAGSYTITCTVKATGDLLATRTYNVTVSSAATPTVTATPATICSGSSSSLVATSSNSAIKWYTVASGGTSIGTSASGAGFSVSPAATTNYYAEAASASGCVNSTRTLVKVTVGAFPTAFTVNGGGSYCTGSAGVALSLSGSETGVNYQLKLNGVNTGTAVAGTGAGLSFGLQSAIGTYTVTATNATSGCINPMTGSKDITQKTRPTAAISGTQLICNGSSAQVSLAMTGTGPWSGTLSNGQAFSGSTNPLTVTVSPASNTTFSISTLSDANCSATSADLSGSAVVTVGTSGEWRGITSNWHDGQNWCTGTAPVVGMNIVIPVTANNPVISSGTAFSNNLTVNAGATLTVAAGTLKISGAITSTQAIVVIDGTIEMNGSSIQTIAGSNFLANSLKNLTVSNANGLSIAATVNDSLKVTGAIAFGNVNNSTITTNGNLVLVSNSKGTARVADVTNKNVNSGNKFSGKVTVERYFPARRSWRMFTAPVSGGGSIYDNWQNKGVYKAGIGTYVSGTSATNPIGANGLDWSAMNNVSLKAGTALASVTNTRTNLLSKNLADTSDNLAYFIFVRGDRSAENTNPSMSNNTTLSSTGKLQTGRQTFVASSSLNGYTLVGNPYAAPVDLDSLVRKNVVKRFYMWDPFLNAEQGGYILFDDYDEDGTYSVTPNSPGGLTKVLQSGQAFFVQTASNNPASVTFQETAKSTSNANLLFRPVGKGQSFRVNLYTPATGSKAALLDGVEAEFNNGFNKAVDIQDAIKLGNVKEILSIQRNENALAIERRPELEANDTIYLTLTRTTKRSYQFEFVPAGIDPLVSVNLIDSYTGITKELSAVSPSTHIFEITDEPASALANRFKIVFKKAVVAIPTVKFTKVNATADAGNVTVNWSVANQENIRKYTVEKSADGVTFTTLTSTNASTNSDYATLDLQPIAGANYYRIVAIAQDGKTTFSNTVMVKMANLPTGMRVYPNPVNQGIIGVEFKDMAAGTYKTKLVNTIGQTMLHQQINHAAGTSKEYINPSFKLASGIYNLEIATPGNTTFSLKVVVE
ncbi:MAG: T9SS type A sorting domain-containing protein [Ferruginibacter sp.]|nr:T9SS type A sorting domain-containing protein [Ferruginibacter sp.]